MSIAVARIAGIMAAKKTQELIPLCHQIPLSRVTVDFAFEPNGIRDHGRSPHHRPNRRGNGSTNRRLHRRPHLYDMSKAVDKSMVIEGITLLSKTKEIPPSPTREP
jgi:cyclic pyranopterin monophosphate synthase